MKRIVTMAVSAFFMATAVLGFSGTANAAEDWQLTAKGDVVLVGGSGNVEDVKLTVQYGNVEPGDDSYMATVRWYGNPDAEGHFSIPTEIYQYGLHLIRVTAELEGYKSDYDVLTSGEDTTQRLILKADGSPSSVGISGEIKWEDGSALPGNLCPNVSITMSNTGGVSKIKACAGHWNCNAIPGKDVVVTPELDGYEFIPASITVHVIEKENNAINFVIRPVGSKKTDETTAAESTKAVETTTAAETAAETTAAETTAVAESTKAAETEAAAEELVTLYRDRNYKGKSITLGEGEYRMNQLGQLGNDKLSSLRVPAGYKVTLYQHDKFRGKTMECTEDISFLGDSYHFNDLTSSIIITRE